MSKILVSRARRLQRVQVRGESMTPTLQPGDRLVVLRTPKLRRDDLVAIRDPRDTAQILVKRVTSFVPRPPGQVVAAPRSRSEQHLVVLGDNPPCSTDSRTFGPVPPELVVGRALYRYFPPDRAGRVTGRGARGSGSRR